MFTWFDIIILMIITTSSMFGVYEGMVKFTISLLGFILSMFFTYCLFSYISGTISQYFINNIVLLITSGIISYIISWIICSFLTCKFLLMISVISGGVIDRSLGLIVGMLRGTIICLCIFLVLKIFFSDIYLQAKTLKDVIHNTTMDKYPQWLKESMITPYLDNLSKDLIEIILQDDLKFIKKLPQKSEIIDSMYMLKRSHYKNFMKILCKKL